ncbi:MAG: hypothetical protein BTN85_1624 [Candidatus Methanohalarchaeum thermophilum]|uniref:Uncharacterized protein n=1 Tax=Methanohalarchaeum thermophilum TaxID=1903181 RepID=A0A1Q6DXQ6_METT1|nr:MAG: hypothetical protein BTN85_1624 [Candidatus Methanohalarchaeum thermophilum]
MECMQVEKRIYKRIRSELSSFGEEDQELDMESLYQKVKEELEGEELGEDEIQEIMQRISFYLSALSQQKMYFDPEVGSEERDVGAKEVEYFPPPWFLPIPLLGEGAWLFQLKDDSGVKREVPKIEVDFLLNYAESSGFATPSLIRVVSDNPEYTDVSFQQWLLSIRIGFIYQVAYPKEAKIGFNGIEDWNFLTPCPHCESFSETVENCSKCGKQIYPHSISSNESSIGGILQNIQEIDTEIFGNRKGEEEKD